MEKILRFPRCEVQGYWTWLQRTLTPQPPGSWMVAIAFSVGWCNKPLLVVWMMNKIGKIWRMTWSHQENFEIWWLIFSVLAQVFGLSDLADPWNCDSRNTSMIQWIFFPLRIQLLRWEQLEWLAGTAGHSPSARHLTLGLQLCLVFQSLLGWT